MPVVDGTTHRAEGDPTVPCSTPCMFVFIPNSKATSSSSSSLAQTNQPTYYREDAGTQSTFRVLRHHTDRLKGVEKGSSIIGDDGRVALFFINKTCPAGIIFLRYFTTMTTESHKVLLLLVLLLLPLLMVYRNNWRWRSRRYAKFWRGWSAPRAKVNVQINYRFVVDASTVGTGEVNR